MRISDWSSDVCSSDLIAGNLSGIVGALAEIRNRNGIAGHGQHDSQDLPSQTDIRIFVSIFERVISLLWHAFNKFNIDLALTKLRCDLIEKRLHIASYRSESRRGGTECGNTLRSRWLA